MLARFQRENFWFSNISRLRQKKIIPEEWSILEKRRHLKRASEPTSAAYLGMHVQLFKIDFLSFWFLSFTFITTSWIRTRSSISQKILHSLPKQRTKSKTFSFYRLERLHWKEPNVDCSPRLGRIEKFSAKISYIFWVSDVGFVRHLCPTGDRRSRK